jgi:hypothetical protein
VHSATQNTVQVVKKKKPWTIAVKEQARQLIQMTVAEWGQACVCVRLVSPPSPIPISLST